ncbi:MAG: UMP kinase [Hyphomicrobiales bacterium]|nr:MAG: UMP kinase [Hyphomicrobiales bacterium]
MSTALKYRRVLLKLSGEALMGERGFGIDPDFVQRIAEDIREAVALGAKVGIVIGGGNIFRGVSVVAEGGERVVGDHMGMLATVINSIAISSALRQNGVPSRVLSALPVPTVCDTFSQRAADAAFDAGEVVVFAGGTGNPFFTTDSGAALRASEMGCDALLKGTQVDGIYTADPKKDPTATRYERVSYQEALAKGLGVMDTAAFALARDNAIPIIVFSIHQPGSIVDAVCGQGRSTLVESD